MKIQALNQSFKIFKSQKFYRDFACQIYLEKNQIHIFHKGAKLFISIQVQFSNEDRYGLIPFHSFREASEVKFYQAKFDSFHLNTYDSLSLRIL